MAKAPGKTQLSEDKKSALMKLAPITYKITLIYLGASRIKRVKGAAYNTHFDLRNGADPDSDSSTDALAIIENVVNDETPDAASMKAAKMYGDGGDDTNPTSDTVYRIAIIDNHGTRTAENLKLLDTTGDNYGDVQYYKDMGWLPEVNPALPFRAIIRKYVGATPVNYDSDHTLLVEVKDPVEEFDTNNTPQRSFLKTFFKTYNRTSNTDTVGDDNAPKIFAGLRDHPGANPGAKGTAILKSVPYKDPPKIDIPGTGADPLGFNSVDFASLGEGTAAGAMQVKFPVTVQKGTVHKIGVVDFAMLPGACGGDNYRMLLTLLDSSGTDARKNKESNVTVFVQDNSGTLIPSPRAYTTGRFIVWRRTSFKLCVLVNGTAEADLDWGFIKGVYKKAFMELRPPKSGSAPAGGFFTLTVAQWAQIVGSVMSDVPEAQVAANFTPATYAVSLFPPAVATAYTPRLAASFAAAGTPAKFIPRQIAGTYQTKLLQIAKQAVTLACSQASPVIPDPFTGNAQTKQDDGNGPYMFLCRDGIAGVPPSNIGTVLGAYEGDRLFWFRNPGGPTGNTWATSTAAHELGHLRSLRHSHTSESDATYSSGGTNTAINLVGPYVNGNPMDHDPLDAYHCLMGYLRRLDSDHCAMCQLSLRFYDRVAIQKAGNYKEQLLKTEGPVTLVQVAIDASQNITLTPVGPATALSLAAPQSVDVMAVGPEIPFRDRSGTDNKGRVNMSDVPKDEGGKWTVGGQVGAITITEIDANQATARYRVTAAGVGVATLQFRHGLDPTAACVFVVT